MGPKWASIRGPYGLSHSGPVRGIAVCPDSSPKWAQFGLNSGAQVDPYFTQIGGFWAPPGSPIGVNRAPGGAHMILFGLC